MILYSGMGVLAGLETSQLHIMQGETAVGPLRELLMLTLNAACAATCGNNTDVLNPANDLETTVQFRDTMFRLPFEIDRAYS